MGWFPCSVCVDYCYAVGGQKPCEGLRWVSVPIPLSLCRGDTPPMLVIPNEPSNRTRLRRALARKAPQSFDEIGLPTFRSLVREAFASPRWSPV